jgi:hypothetical protein
MTDTFEGQEGAAVYRTNEGDFEALFLPKPQNFNKLQVIERYDGQSYRYSLCGAPRAVARQSDREHFSFVFCQASQRVDRRAGPPSCDPH